MRPIWQKISVPYQSIDKGQYEAAKALGMTYRQTMQLIILPQTIRRLIPPVGTNHYGTERCFTCGYHCLSDLTKDKSHFVFTGNSPCVYSGYGYLSDYYRFLLIHFQQNGKEILGL
ncbi:MAG: hypothetical protein V8R00_02665 [Coprococcus catus]